jgi:hypothetical protein
MSDLVPHPYTRPSTLHMGGTQRLNPAASNYTPELHSQNKTPNQVSAPSSPYLEARVLNLEEEHYELRVEVARLTELYHDLRTSVDELMDGGHPVPIGPFQKLDPIQSHQSALKFREELEQLSRKDDKSVARVTDVHKVNDTMSETNVSVPPRLRGLNSVPPHLRFKKTNG